jgi:hypothetical protein
VFSTQHFGRYFTPAHVQAAQEQRDKPPFDAAWKVLHEHQETGLHASQWLGLRYRFQLDNPAGEQAVERLREFVGHGLDADMTYVDALQQTLILAHAFELVRDHPAMASVAEPLLKQYDERVRYLNQLDHERTFIEQVMLGHLNLVSGIVLEREDLYRAGVETYEEVVREDIHPQGYIQRAVAANDGGGLLRQLMVVSALVQMAEADKHVGGDLWQYSFRGVSVSTAFSYLIYYYFFPEKWRWDQQVTNEPFKEYGGFLEIVNHHAYPKDLKPILDELRPIYDVCGGGLTTLSHGMAGRPKRGLFRK